MKFRSPHTPLRLIPYPADNTGNDRMQHFGPLAQGQSKRADACATLFKVCGAAQNELLDPLGITCFFEADGGALADWRCSILAQIIKNLMAEICRGLTPQKCRGGRITVSLHHTGQIWVLAVTDEGIRNFDDGRTIDRLSSVNGLALSLKGSSRTRLASDGATTAVLFSAMPWWFDTGEPETLIAPRLALEYTATSQRHEARKFLA